MASELSVLNEDSRPHALPPIDGDPVLLRVQQGLLMQGDEISKIVMAGNGANSGGGDVMNALIHLMAEQQQPAAPVETHSQSGGGSSAGAWIGAGLSLLGAGASAASSFAGKAPAAPVAKTASTTPTPPPANADKPAAAPEVAPKGNPQPEAKPEQNPAQDPAQNPAPVVAKNDKAETPPDHPKPGPTKRAKKAVKPAQTEKPANKDVQQANAADAPDTEAVAALANALFGWIL